jgi:hypothetical protein
MPGYCVNKNQQPNGDHEVHKEGCDFWPNPGNRIPLGNHKTRHGAVLKAKQGFVDLSQICR